MKSYLLATFLLMSWTNSIAQEEGGTRCAASNVAFIMDMSQTTSGSHASEKEIVQKLVDRFPEKSRYSLVVFGEKAVTKARFEPDLSATKFKTMVKDLNDKEAGMQASKLGEAVDAMSNVIFPSEKGRDTNVLFILTDGRWTYNKKTISNPMEAIRRKMKNLFSSNVRVIVLAIGSSTDARILSGLVPLPRKGQDIIYFRKNPQKFHHYLKEAIAHACEKRPTEPDCETKMDLGFIIDRSGSIGFPKFDNNVKPFIINVARRFNISKDGVHAGVEVFSNPNDTKVVIGIGSKTNIEDFVKAVNEKVKYPINYPKHFTYINVALKRANENFFNYKPREKVKRYALLVTDGKQSKKFKYRKYNNISSEKEARKLWKKKVNILAIGVGSVDEAALMKLTDNEKHGKFIKVDNFDKLKDSMTAILSSVCTICSLKLVLVVDASGSSKSRYEAERYLLLDIATQMNLKSGGSQASVITFYDKGKLAIKFDPHGRQSRAMFEVEVYDLKFPGGRTKVESGLKYVNEAMEIGPDNGLKKAVLVITDGLQDYDKLDEIKTQSEAIRSKGYPIKTITFNTKRWAEHQENRKKKPLRTLEAITGNEKDNYFLGYSTTSASDQKFQKLVTPVVIKVLRSFCGLK